MTVCEFGTRVKAGAPTAIYLTSAAIRTWLGVEAAWLEPALRLIGDELVIIEEL